MDLNRATEVNAEVEKAIINVFEYHPWDARKREEGKLVRDALAIAFAVIIRRVPPCPDRSAALRKLREARMDCNSAITHDGKY